MNEVIGWLFLVSVFVLPFLPYRRVWFWWTGNRVDVRTIKGLSLTPTDWALLGGIAAKKRVSQENLISDVLKNYLEARVNDDLVRRGRR